MEYLLILSLIGIAFLAWKSFKMRQKLQQQAQEINSLRYQGIDRDNLEQRLKSAKEQYQIYALAFHVMSSVTYDLLFVLDKEGLLIAFNNTAQEKLTESLTVGQKLTDLIDIPDYGNLIRSIIVDAEPFEMQIKIDESFYRLRAQTFTDYGQTYVGMALQDVTQLVKLNRARRDMVANISHELRTPIANIRMILDALFLEADKPKRKESIESLHAINQETDNLLWMVQELMDLSMIESGQAIIRLVDNNIKELVDQSILRLEKQLKDKDIRIVNHVPTKLEVLCDADQTRRVLVNLLHNAKKWAPAKDVITVNAREIDDFVEISILDNGPGVPPDQVERIFERFYQVDASRSAHEGTGLGLAICRHIIKAQGGEIWTESNESGKGGHFSFTLLKDDAAAAAELDEWEPPTPLETEALPLKESAFYEKPSEDEDKT
ncbi:ATP-binding protein [Anaerolineales bacterium]